MTVYVRARTIEDDIYRTGTCYLARASGRHRSGNGCKSGGDGGRKTTHVGGTRGGRSVVVFAVTLTSFL